LINGKGKLIVPVVHPYVMVWGGKVIIFNYDPCFDCDGLFLYSYEGKVPSRDLGVYSLEGKPITVIAYDAVEHVFDNGSFILRDGENFIFFDKDAKEKPIR
jgi:hypothetical protein